MVEFEMYGHASVLIRYQGQSILTDPWFDKSNSKNVFSAFPPVKVPTEQEVKSISAIQISHIHKDHFCPDSLSVFPRTIPIFIMKSESQEFYREITELGFGNVIQIPPGVEGYEFGHFRIYQFPQVGSRAFDSSVVFKVNGQFYYLNNDTTYNPALCQIMRAAFGKFHGCFLGFNFFNPSPLCYDLTECENFVSPLSHDELVQRAHLSRWRDFSSICELLSPEWVVPYASGIRFLNEDTFHYNSMFSNPYQVHHVDTHDARAHVLWPHDVITGAGEVRHHVTHNVESCGYDKDEPGSLFKAPAFAKLHASVELLSHEESMELGDKFCRALKSLLKFESAKWPLPTTVKFRILTQSEPLIFCFQFDGAEVKQVGNQVADLEIDYPSSLLKKVILEHAPMNRIHYSFSRFFNVKIRRFLWGQQGVINWGQGWVYKET